jgi:hypothetical protein
VTAASSASMPPNERRHPGDDAVSAAAAVGSVGRCVSWRR